MPSNYVQTDVSNHEARPQEAATSPLPEGNSNDALLNDLQAQVRIIGKMKPSLSALAELYQKRKSRIDQFVEWYSDKSLSEKVWIGGVVVSASYVVGSLLGIAWLLTGLVTALYATATAILEEHAELIRKRDALFLEDIPKMEASIEASIESFRVLEDKLNTVFQSLNTLNIKRSEGISSFEDNVDTMGEHNLRYTALIESLGKTAERLSEHQAGVALDKTELDGLCTELQNRLQEAEAMTSTLSGLVSTVEQELNDNMKPESSDHQGAVDVPPISNKTEMHFSKIDREIELRRNPNKTPNAHKTSSVNHPDEDFSDIDQALKELRLADNASKANPITHSNQKRDGAKFTIPYLF